MSMGASPKGMEDESDQGQSLLSMSDVAAVV